MKLRTGADSGETGKSNFSNLKAGDVLYSVAYEAASDSVSFDAYEFDKYIKQHTTTEKIANFYVLKEEDGKAYRIKQKDNSGKETFVTAKLDVTAGLFRDKKSALDSFKEVIGHINEVVQNATIS